MLYLCPALGRAKDLRFVRRLVHAVTQTKSSGKYPLQEDIPQVWSPMTVVSLVRMLHLYPTLTRAENSIPRNEWYACHARPNRIRCTPGIRQNRRTNALAGDDYVKLSPERNINVPPAF